MRWQVRAILLRQRHLFTSKRAVSQSNLYSSGTCIIILISDFVKNDFIRFCKPHSRTYVENVLEKFSSV